MLFMLTEIEKAYWAGLLDGEGTIGLYTHHDTMGKYRSGYAWNPFVRIYLSKGHEILNEIVNAYQGKLKSQINKNTGLNHKTQTVMWYVLFGSCKKIRPLLVDLLPYLRIKKAQAELLLEYCNLRMGAHTLVTKNLFEIIAISDQIKELNSGHRIYKKKG